MEYTEEYYKKDLNLLRAGKTGALIVVDKILDNCKDINKQQLEQLKLMIHEEVEDFFNFDESLNSEKTSYQYSSEILKLYDKKTGIGITIKAEFLDNTITNIEGFELDFNRLEINEMSEEQVKEIYQIYKQNPELIEEQIQSLKYTNKDLCELNYQEIRDKFTEKSQIKRLENQEEEEEEYE